MDRISDLPKTILHDILSRLPDKDAARTSVLSKAWHETWSTFPILVFDGFDRGILLRLEDRQDPLKIQDHKRKVNSFLNSVDRTLVRFQQQGFAIKEFSLSMMFFHPQFMPHRIDRWMKIVSLSKDSIKVLKLELDVTDHPFGFGPFSVDKYYYLPPDVLKAKSLTKLELEGMIRVDKLFVNHRIRFSMLQILSLSNVYLGHQQAFDDLISGCPMIEDLTLEYCFELENVKLHDLPKLKSVKVSGVSEIDIDVPGLEYLHIANEDIELPCNINIDKCRNLKVFILGAVSSVFVSNQWSLETFNKFPFLERLELNGCVTSESITISSFRLKVLSIKCCNEMKEAKIHAPNLDSFRYFGTNRNMPAISFVNCSDQMEFDAVFSILICLDLERFRAFLQNIEPRNIMASLTLRIGNGSSIAYNEDVLQNVGVPLPMIKQLNLYVSEESQEVCVLLINGLFWSFRPAIVSLKLKYCSKIFVKVLLEKLRCKDEEDGCCSSSNKMKCWWHDLKDVKVKSFPMKYENLFDCEALLDSLPTRIYMYSPDREISFQLEWDSSE
ncbi:hypothetical protein PIB30_012214 [Stylosanthes scabra]|uniref:F-box domain-containing protein n=1 Tax=Stylosanthes scabra TaxID=79078 RepID=A0ABU6U5F0_9FABA|nr:hypothetical protein [Stylosanthes scabra]